MRENKLRVNITATLSLAGVGSVHYIKIGYGRLSPQWHNAIVAAGGAFILIGTALRSAKTIMVLLQKLAKL